MDHVLYVSRNVQDKVANGITLSGHTDFQKNIHWTEVANGTCVVGAYRYSKITLLDRSGQLSCAFCAQIFE